MRLKQERLFNLFAAVFRRKQNSGPWAEFSQAVRARIDQSTRNGNCLTIVVLDPNSCWNGSYSFADYFAQRIILVVSKICIRREIVFFPVERERALLFEAARETSESVLAEAREALRREDILFGYKTGPCDSIIYYGLSCQLRPFLFTGKYYHKPNA